MTQATSPRALVTGASGGIGYELAKLFAQDGTSLVLVTRQADKLQAMQADFEPRYRIQVAYLALDLSAKTGFVARANMGRSADAQGRLLDAAQVARAGYRGRLRGRLNVVPGLRGKLLSFSAGLLPSRRLLLAIATLVSRPTR